MRYRGIIFDLDGVICHTDQYHYEAWKEIADKLCIPFDETINNRLRGVSRMESLNIILENYSGEISADDKAMYAEGKNLIYKQLLQRMSPSDLDDTVKKTLEELRTRGFKLAIGSSSKNARLILDKLEIQDFFDVISDGNNIVNSKPDPEVFQNAAKALNLPNEECLVIEDAVAGIEAANAAGMDSCGIGEAAIYKKTTYKIEELRDILNIVGG